VVKLVRIVGDKILAKFVPQLDGHAACTPAERECWCDADGQGADWLCEWCQLCNGRVHCWGMTGTKGCP
jgi:hypothetical protein